MAGAADVAALVVSLRLDDKGFTGKLNAAAATLGRMDKGLSQMGRGAGQVAGGVARLGAVAGAAAVGGLAAVVTTAASFEQAFTGVEKTVDGTEAQLSGLEETLRKMAREMPVSFEELAGIAEAGGALGIAFDSLDEFTDIVARLSVSTNLSSEQAATALGQLSNVLGLSASDMQAFGDSLVALGNAGASTEDQIVEMAARFGAAGRSAGLSNEEILALSSTVASMGIDVEAGGSSLSRLFNNVATNIGTSNDKAKAFADSLGLSLGELRTSWETDALGTFQDLLEVINELDQFEAAALLKDLGVTNTRDVNALRLLASGAEELGDQLTIAEGATGALATESDKFFATTQGQWQTLKNNVRDAGAVIGSELLPVVNEAMSALVDWLNQADTQQGLKDFAKDLAVGVRGLVDELKGTDFSGLVGGLKLAAEVAKGAFDAFRALPAPIQQLAVAALIANKVSGGAIGMIAKGLGNLVLGSLKTITAANVTVIGGNVTGGPGGVPAGGGGGGLLAGLKTGVALASPVLAGIAAVEVINFENMRNEQRAKLDGILDEMPRTPAKIDESIAAIQAQIDMERPFLEGVLFNTNVKPQLEEQIAELQEVKRRQELAAGFARDAIPWAVRNVQAVHTLNASEGRRFADLGAKSESQKQAINAFNASEGTRFANLGAKQDGVAMAVKGQSGVLAQIRDKKSSVTVKVGVTNNVSVSDIQRRVTSQNIALGISNSGFAPT
jgi:TP901 family phage tail tape measure protein